MKVFILPAEEEEAPRGLEVEFQPSRQAEGFRGPES